MCVCVYIIAIPLFIFNFTISLFIHPSINTQVAKTWILATVNKCSMDMKCRCFLRTPISYPVDMYTEVGSRITW